MNSLNNTNLANNWTYLIDLKIEFGNGLLHTVKAEYSKEYNKGNIYTITFPEGIYLPAGLDEDFIEEALTKKIISSHEFDISKDLIMYRYDY